MNIIIIGSGAMGLLFYKQLYKTHHVTLLSRNRKPQGNVKFTFTNLNGLSNQHSITVADGNAIKSADLVISTVKAYDVLTALTQTPVSNTVPIILMHNGMGAYDEVKQHVSNPLLQLLTTQASKQHAKFHIQHTGSGNNQLGALNLAANTHQDQIFKQLKDALPNLLLSKNITTLQWKKLAVNCAINPLTAIYNVNNGELAETCYQHTIINITREVVNVAKLEGIKLIEEDLLNVIYQVIENTRLNSSSMRQDIIYKRKTEIDYINGYIVKMGLKHHVLTPFNKQICQQINAL